MKKSLLAIVVGALAVASTANAGLYAEGDLGLSRTKLSNGGSSKTKVEPRVAYKPAFAVEATANAPTTIANNDFSLDNPCYLIENTKNIPHCL